MPSRRTWQALGLAVLGCSVVPRPEAERVAAAAADVKAAVVDVARAASSPVADSRPPLAALQVRAALPATLPRELRWLAIGGGATPEFNQVSIEQDVALAQEIFGTGGAVLFAGGAGSHGVQVADANPRGDSLLLALGELFTPRGGRSATYRPTALRPIAAATARNAVAALKAAVAEPGPPLLVYLAGHGERGETPRLGGIGLWGLESLHVVDLAEVLDASRRPVRVVATSCFSGSFGELAFRRADPAAGAASERCGLFASTDTRESSGCDPNPDRAAQEGFGLHFLNALRGKDRSGKTLPEIDLDRDGKISLLEAHARARIAGGGIDVPTTTSERWLRAAAPARGRTVAVALPEEEAVISALEAALGLRGEAAATGALEQVLKDMDAAQDRLGAAGVREDAAFREAAAELLARWPVLDDPRHPDFAATIERHRDEISEFIAASAAYAGFRAAQSEVGTAQDAVGELLARSARIERLVRAYENRALAGRLKARGGAGWQTYEALLACERSGLP